MLIWQPRLQMKPVSSLDADTYQKGSWTIAYFSGGHAQNTNGRMNVWRVFPIAPFHSAVGDKINHALFLTFRFNVTGITSWWLEIYHKWLEDRF